MSNVSTPDRLREDDTYDEPLVHDRPEDIEAAKRFWERWLGKKVDVASPPREYHSERR